MAATTVPGQLLAALKARKYTTVARLFANDVDFQAWTNAGHWTASDPATVAKIIECWFTPGASSSIVFSNESAGARGAAMLECEIAWVQPDEQPRVLRQVYLMTVNKQNKIASVRVYCPGPHIEFPEVDLEKQRRARGIGVAPKVAPAAAAKAS